MNKNLSNQEIQYMIEAFESFKIASQSLESSYLELQEKASKLDLELKLKNEELIKNLEEKERVKNFMQSILDSIDIGLLALNESGDIEFLNNIGRKMLLLTQKSKTLNSVFTLNLPDSFLSYIEMCLANPEVSYPETIIKIEDKVFELNNYPVLNADKKVISTLVLLKDITIVQKLKQQSLRTARLAAMGEMAAEIAHEIRNPLGSMKLFASMLEDDLTGSEQQKLVQNIISGINSVNSVVTNMLTFSREMELHVELIDLKSLLNETLEFSSHSFEQYKVTVKTDFPEKRVAILGDKELLKQLFLNLFLNASNAIEENGGILTVSLKEGEFFVDITVEDTGKGIEQAFIDKIFDPFFTTSQGGTGLGLSVVNKIIEKHKGAITVDSEVGVGTVFTISLKKEGLEV
jgi:nitrogen fixation/metabolism regulation signal transduction histidine kinase